MQIMRRLVLFFVAISLFCSCRTINPSVMFKTAKDYPYTQPDSASKLVQSEYKLAEYDELELYIYTNNGYKLVDITGTGAASTTNTVRYLIEKDGFAKLPQLGRIALKGYTIQEAAK